ncbi:MAG: hypothetical protein ACYTHK_15135 [Planctomycetota bacterium]|jgi:hypothetical protein
MRQAWTVLLIAAVACSGGGSEPGGGGNLDAVPLLLTAGNVRVDPVIEVTAATYDLTTPAGEPFSFDLISRSENNTGSVRLSISQDTFDSPESIARAGITVHASGALRRGAWIDAHGDGFVRMTIGGSIADDQELRVEVEEDGDVVEAIVRIRIGPSSQINLESPARGTYDGILDEQTIYSSNSWRFGLPTAARSGDRTSIVVYEGDQADPFRFERYEVRLQHDASNGNVTGGGTPEPSADLGHWRDHEVAALFNVLALARCGEDGVTLKLSFDRGATFAQTQAYAGPARLVQIAMALDYTVAIAFWRMQELVLIEGRPSAFDANNSPTAYSFDPPRTIYSDTGSISPVIMGLQYSEGGDLVLGFGLTGFTSDPATRIWRSRTSFWCTVRPFGAAAYSTLVEESEIVGKDPSVALVGSGASMRIYYAYEGAQGVQLRWSTDAGRSFSAPMAVGDATAHMPTVLARGAVVDLLYLADRGQGRELHLRHWDDFDAGGFEDVRLTTAKTESTGTLPPDAPMPGAREDFAPPQVSSRVTQVAWFGYDAFVEDDEVVVVYDEETVDFDVFFGAPVIGVPFDPVLDAASGAPEFQPAEPPPLAPGLTEPVPAPDPDDMHQLRILRLR